MLFILIAEFYTGNMPFELVASDFYIVAEGSLIIAEFACRLHDDTVLNVHLREPMYTAVYYPLLHRETCSAV